MNFSIPGLVEAASEISEGLQQLSESVRLHRVQMPQTKAELAYQLALASAAGGDSTHILSGDRLAPYTNQIWDIMKEFEAEEVDNPD